MELVGPWFSPFTRRVGITLNLLGFDFRHNALHAFEEKERVKSFNPMGKVPILVLEDGETLIDSSAIADYLDERVGPDRALLPSSGRDRRDALQIVSVALATIEKAGAVYYEFAKETPGAPALDRVDAVGQTLAGLELLEAAAQDGWFGGHQPNHADIASVVAIQTAQFVLREAVDMTRYPKLAALSARAMEMPAFTSTLPAM